MRRTATREIVIILMSLWISWSLVIGCSLQPTVPETAAADPAAELFAAAQRSYQRGALEQALTQYNQYLSQFPQGRDIDSALFRMGDTYQQLNNIGAAQAFLQRLIDEHPQSQWIDQARLQLIDMLIANQENDQAILTAEQMLTAELPQPTRQLLYRHLTRLHLAAGHTAETARFLFLQYEMATDDSKELLLNQLKSLVERLQETEIQMLWKIMDDHQIRGDLMFRNAMLQVMAENDDDALRLLTVFQAAYPDHPLVDEAGQFISTLASRLAFAPHTLGCLLPLSGDYQAYGLRALKGIEMALSLVSGSESGSPIKLLVEDTGSSANQAVEGVRKLAEAGVAVIIGPVLTATEAAKESQRLGIPMIAFTQKPDVALIGDWIFQHFITPQNQVNTLINYLVDDRGLFRFAVLYPQEAYGQTFMNLFWEAAVRKGATMTAVESYDLEITDFAEPIRKLVGTYYPVPDDLSKPAMVLTTQTPYYRHRLQSVGSLEERYPDPVLRLSGLFPLESALERQNELDTGNRSQPLGAASTVDFDALFIPDAPNKVGLILPQLAYYDIQDVIMAGTNIWHSAQLIEMTKDFAQNVVIVDGFFIGSQSGVVQGFVDQYRRVYNEDPGIIEAFSFDTANLLFSLLSRSDIQTRPDLRSALHQCIVGQGATGPVYFADNGAAIKHLSLLQLKDGQFSEINRP